MQAQVINLLESLKHQLGLTMVIVAHGLAVIRHMSDRVAVMYLGQIVELASVDGSLTRLSILTPRRSSPLHRRCSRAPDALPHCWGIYRTRPIPVRVPIPYPLSVCHG